MRRNLLATIAALQLVAPVALAALWPATPAAGVDLMGTWHVLAHYKDSTTTHPERERWEDRIWVFSMEGDRLKWIDYPIVVFADQSGRFERGSGRAARVLQFWEPSPDQLLEIREGLEINTRGSRTKTLRATSDGYTSAKRKAGYRSTRFITFTETWTIEGLPDAPVFTRDDVMGSATTESFEGRTQYTSDAVEEGGNVLRGSYDRDGTRTGRFVLRRAGATSVVKGSGRSAGERVYDAFFGELGSSLYKGEVPPEYQEKLLRESIEQGTFGNDERKELRLFFEQTLTEHWTAQGNDPALFRREIHSLADKMVRAFADDGKTIEEIQSMIANGQLRP